MSAEAQILALLRRGYGRLTGASKARVDAALGFSLGAALEQLQEPPHAQPCPYGGEHESEGEVDLCVKCGIAFSGEESL